ncbi:MAG: methyltransferase domain-containing protein [Defluviitaleaceae bacterium]|nr:methyltransferase domain-containing protein [Defluviitaleaceae bacterium]
MEIWRNFTEIAKYRRANKYDYNWVAENWMGPNPLYLTEELCENMTLRPGMKVLDMGCGKGCSSVFLAKEFGVTVFATDLWIKPTENLRRFEAAGVADRVFPVHADVNALPYAEGFFDAVVSVSSLQYYGTSDAFFPDILSKQVKPGGEIGVVINGHIREDGVPCENDGGANGFHSGKWWRNHWEKTGLAEITACYDFENPKAADEGQFITEGFNASNYALIVMAAKVKSAQAHFEHQ